MKSDDVHNVALLIPITIYESDTTSNDEQLQFD